MTESGTPTYDWYGDETSATSSFTIAAEVDASTSKRIATFYLGVWYGKGHLELSLSDASAPSYTSDALDMSNGQTIVKYTADFRAGAPTAKLRLRWTLAKAYVSQGSIRIAAITLQ